MPYRTIVNTPVRTDGFTVWWLRHLPAWAWVRHACGGHWERQFYHDYFEGFEEWVQYVDPQECSHRWISQRCEDLGPVRVWRGSRSALAQALDLAGMPPPTP